MNVKFIIVDDEYRKISREDPEVISLAEDIKNNGLLQAIGINRNKEIVWGRKRLFAVKEILGQQNIDVRTIDVDGNEKELRTIAENLFRKTLSFWERGESLKRYYELMAEKYPDRFTKEGARQGGRVPDALKETYETTKDIADSTGTAERTIREDIQLARDIHPEVKPVLIKHGIQKRAARAISALPHKNQLKVAAELEQKGAKKDIRKVLAQYEIDPEKTKNKLRSFISEPEKPVEKKAPEQPAFDFQVFGHSKFGQEVSHMLRARDAGVNVLPVQLVYIERAKKAFLVYYHTADKPPTPTLLNILRKTAEAVTCGQFLGVHTVGHEIDEKGEHWILQGKRVSREKMESFVSGTASKSTYEQE